MTSNGGDRDEEQLHEDMTILTAGKWYIAELDDPQLVVQGESEALARNKLIKRYQKYTSDGPGSSTLPDTRDPREIESTEELVSGLSRDGGDGS